MGFHEKTYETWNLTDRQLTSKSHRSFKKMGDKRARKNIPVVESIWAWNKLMLEESTITKDSSDNFLWSYREIDAQKINSGEWFLDGLLRDAGKCSLFHLACQNSNFLKTL